MEKLNIFFFGDSICFGQGSSVTDTWISLTNCYLNENLKNVEVMINNPSINGNTTRMALERMPHDIQDHEVDILVVEFGMNDCNYWQTDKGLPRVSKAGFKANLHEIIQRGLNVGAKKVVLLTNHISGKNKDIMRVWGGV